jgi:hypothetical protein
MDMISLIVKAQCGELSYLCCLGSADKLIELARLVSDKTDTDLRNIYRIACVCDVAGGAPRNTNPTPAAPSGPAVPGMSGMPRTVSDTCVAKMTEYVCSPMVQTALATSSTALRVAIASMDPTSVRRAWMERILFVVDALLAVCSTSSRDAIEKAALAVCSLMDWLQGSGTVAREAFPKALQGLFDYVVSYLILGVFGTILEMCCGSQGLPELPSPGDGQPPEYPELPPGFEPIPTAPPTPTGGVGGGGVSMPPDFTLPTSADRTATASETAAQRAQAAAEQERAYQALVNMVANSVGIPAESRFERNRLVVQSVDPTRPISALPVITDGSFLRALQNETGHEWIVDALNNNTLTLMRKA